MRRFAAGVALVVALATLRGIPTILADSPFKVIVHPSVKGSQIARATLGSVFLKQLPRWGDGVPAKPVDQSMRSSIRLSFASEVLQRPLPELQFYWSRKVLAGVAPPPVKQTDEEVTAFVESTSGAIGYVSATHVLPDSVRELVVVD
jgi:ABC-type phosphate transport system substrate-binding protein